MQLHPSIFALILTPFISSDLLVDTSTPAKDSNQLETPSWAEEMV